MGWGGTHSTPIIPPLPPPFPTQPSAFEERAIAKVDDLLESYMGIRDTELGEPAPKGAGGVGGVGGAPRGVPAPGGATQRCWGGTRG